MATRGIGLATLGARQVEWLRRLHHAGPQRVGSGAGSLHPTLLRLRQLGLVDMDGKKYARRWLITLEGAALFAPAPLEPSNPERPTTIKEDTMAKKTAAEKAKAAKAAKAKRARANQPKATAKPVLTQEQKDAREAKRVKEYEANKVAMGKTRVVRRSSRDAVYTAALKRFWALVKGGENFRYGDIGIKIGATASIAKLAGDTELSPADWRNVGLRCNRHYEGQGAVETVPGTAPRWFRVVAGVDPDTKPRQRVRKAPATKASKAAAKKRATPSPAAAKAKAAKAKKARDAKKAAAAQAEA